VLLRQGEKLGFLFRADLDLVTVHPAAVNIRPTTTGLPTGEATAFTHLSRPSNLPAQRTRKPGDHTDKCAASETTSRGSSQLSRAKLPACSALLSSARRLSIGGGSAKQPSPARAGAARNGRPGGLGWSHGNPRH
jgi:hypothetical protein